MQGWIKLYREILDKPIWIKSTPEQKVILITLLVMANHKENEWEWQGEKFKVEEGQFITSIDSLVKECGKGITTQNIRSALKKFEKYEFLTNKSTKTGRLITLVNWRVYQDEEKETNKATNKEVTKRSQRGNKEVTPNKNDKNNKNDNNDKNNIYITIFDHYISLNLIKHKSLTEAMKKAIEKAMKENKYTLEDMKELLNRHKRVVEETKNNQYPVKVRKLDEFFGQKIQGATSLICTQYEEGGKYYKGVSNGQFRKPDKSKLAEGIGFELE